MFLCQLFPADAVHWQLAVALRSRRSQSRSLVYPLRPSWPLLLLRHLSCSAQLHQKTLWPLGLEDVSVVAPSEAVLRDQHPQCLALGEACGTASATYQPLCWCTFGHALMMQIKGDSFSCELSSFHYPHLCWVFRLANVWMFTLLSKGQLSCGTAVGKARSALTFSVIIR